MSLGSGSLALTRCMAPPAGTLLAVSTVSWAPPAAWERWCGTSSSSDQAGMNGRCRSHHICWPDIAWDA